MKAQQQKQQQKQQQEKYKIIYFGYSHVLLRRHESGRFDVLYSVGISLIFKNIFRTC